MEKPRSFTTTKALMAVSMLVFAEFMMITSIVGDRGVGNVDLGPNAIERGISFISPFEKFTSLIKDHFKIQVSETKQGGSDAGELIKNAAVKSLEETEESVEQTAKAAGEIVHDAADKIKRSVSHHAKQPNDL